MFFSGVLSNFNSSDSHAKLLQDKRCSRDHEADAAATCEDKRGSRQLTAPQTDGAYAVVIARQMYPM